MLRIWGRANSSNVMKVLWLCEELGLAFERIDAGGAFGRTKEPAYLAMNPNARVPTIEEPDGFTLWESNTICRYLVATHAPGHALHPAEPRARARIERWMDWQLGHLNAPMTTLFFTYVRTPEEKRNWPATHAARDEAEALWDMVEGALEGRDFLGGPALSLADIALGPYLHRWLSLPIARKPQPRLAAWYGRLCRRPGYNRHVAVEMS
ncbi:glutathione S-transferase family protein [Rubritepida flocculans]|uniref:glutathione S-transferase family protein n=1 Tax=Rubritepida flocculans TaxID=182403 RepID=UPI0004117321|nr:glutathione S-transferase family protein [Rubritepida flocculans]